MALKSRAASSAKVKAVVKKAKIAKTPVKAAVKAMAKAEKPAKVAKAPPAAAPKASGKPAAKEISKAKEALKAVPAPKPEAAVAAPAPEKAPAKTRSRKISVAASSSEAASALVQKWNSLFKKAEQIDSKPYNMRGVFEEKTAIVHKILGWGYILANRNDRLEVLFKDGIKYLISNYKA